MNWFAMYVLPPVVIITVLYGPVMRAKRERSTEIHNNDQQESPELQVLDDPVKGD